MRMRRFNLNQCLWVIMLVSIFCVILYGLFTGNINNLFTKRTVMLMYPSELVLLIIIIIESTKIFSIPDRDGLKYRNIIFTVSVILLTFGIGIVKSDMVYKDIKIIIDKEDDFDNHEDEEEVPSNGKIDMNKDNYYSYLEEMQKNISSYIGREVSLSGRVMNIDGKYMVVNTVMTCCKADEETYGILLDINDKDNIKINENYIIEGSLSSKDVIYNKKQVSIPVINVTNLKETK